MRRAAAALLLCLAAPAPAQWWEAPNPPTLLEAEVVEATATPYVPPPTPTPFGRPPVIRCWAAEQSSPIWCCYEWRATGPWGTGAVFDTDWMFLQCLR